MTNRCAGYGAALAFAFLTAVSAAAQERVLYSFQVGGDGVFPGGDLIADAKGVLYGTTVEGGDSDSGTVFALSPPAAGKTRWSETVLHSFRGGRDGSFPSAGLIADAKGVLYGTTVEGGDSDSGTVFALSPPAAGGTRWTETVLYSFRGGRDGSFPSAGLIADTRGVLYGTTSEGGITGGTVFALSPPAAGETRWTERELFRFGPPPGGSNPSGLIADAKGVLYGTTRGNGFMPCAPPFCGKVFALSPPAAGETRWTETVLHRFRGPDGLAPHGGLIADAKGVLYGTTRYGGTYCDVCGTVFALSPPTAGRTRWTERVLYSFRGSRDGRDPFAGLIADAKGVLYGTTAGGGDPYCGCGTVFALSPPAGGKTRWTLTALHSLGGSPDGSDPRARLVVGAKGVLYGTTYYGGDSNGGTVFALSPAAAGETR